MEKEKRKRSQEKEREEGSAKRASQREEASEEEVEEFFAILRRMKVAVQYFEKGHPEGWREAVEAEVAAEVADDGNDNDGVDDKEGKRTERSPVLDLNVLPVGCDAED